MAPKAPVKQKSGENMKQKSLMNFFSKPADGAKPTKAPVRRTPFSESPVDVEVLTSPAAPSHGSSDAGDKGTPPTSDPVDVSMLSDEEVALSARKSVPRTKRKNIILESDDEVGTPTHIQSSPCRGRSKKPRVASPSDDECNVASTFLSRLSRFKQAPRNAPAKKAYHSDEFIVPSDSDEDPRDRSSSRASSRSTSTPHSAHDDDDGEDYEGDERTKKSQPKRSLKQPGIAGVSSGGHSLFLTAAEQRAQQQKTEKKATEEPFAFLQDPRDKDGLRPGEPGYDPRTLYIPKQVWASFTPFEKQFWEIKQNHFDTILFFQKGKFLELYEEDARIGHREFDLKLTQRVKMSMVGVPETSFNFWAAKFLGKGYKVGRVDQSETALGAEMRLARSKGSQVEDKGKEKIVRRELNKVYTNGTLVDEELLTDEHAGHCISIREDSSGLQGCNFGICVLDSATSQFDLSAFDDDVCLTKLDTLFRQLRPKEVIFTKGNLSVTTTRLLKAILPSACLWTSLRDVEGYTFEQTIKELNEIFSEGAEDDGMCAETELSSSVPQSIRDMTGCKTAIEALGAMSWYLRQLNIDKDLLTMKNFNVYDPMKAGRNLVLDGQTLAHLEVLQNNEGTDEGTLHKLLSRCITPFGKRLFRIWLCVPLRDVADINNRLDAVKDLIDHPTFEARFTDLVKGLPDLERIVSRIHATNCRVKDFIKVLSAFRKLNDGLASFAENSELFESKTILDLLRSAPDLSPHLNNVQSRFTVDKVTDELLPVDGKDKVYDGVMQEISELEQSLDSRLKKFEKSLGCNLSWWHSASGNKEIYLIQTKVNQENIPDEWVKNSATKTAKRWVVPSLQPMIRRLKEARENRNGAVKDFKGRLYAEFDADRGVWLRAVRVLAEFDCLFSLAKSSVAIGEPSCRPEFVEGEAAFVEFEELRHPTLSALRDNFIPNDVKLGGGGPNMGGKSTAMRMTAAGVIMAQLGMLVPARSARICPIDKILTRMGAYDNMFSNSSTFKVELDECCKILRDATPRSLVILDELGRGTSTYDGMAIAAAVLHELATRTLPLAFFATHYGSLTDDFAYHPDIRNMHMSTLLDDEKQELVFLYKLVEGVASSSFGTHVASLAGVPSEVVSRAEVISSDFAKQFKARIDGQKKLLASKLPLVAHADFKYLLALAAGDLHLPQDPYRQRQLLGRLKAAIRSYLPLDISAR
ncbi:muts domain V-domain-containing protein [Pisolithus orientalis]|uniref:muts domain V-domain-containing protein n=1 Tax=Pisolithus orientalis TaxID=936130 RepID=UPI002225A9E7|nr:muts domain V-domain-containing protein [Pisolithus orientalis]KAI6019884.1 muts domain V-domain-containing protein [Pisolithus orientalis]